MNGRVFSMKQKSAVIFVLLVVLSIINFEAYLWISQPIYDPKTARIDIREHSMEFTKSNKTGSNLILSLDDGKSDPRTMYTFLESIRLLPNTPPTVLIFVADTQRPILLNFKSRFPFVTFIQFDIKDPAIQHFIIPERYRFLVWLRYLTSKSKSNNVYNYQNYDIIFNSDLDVLVQRDPFDIKFQDGLAVFKEYSQMKIKDCEIHLNWFQEAHDYWGDVSSYFAKQRICAGTTMGTSIEYMEYLYRMVEIMNECICNDQATHIHLVYSNQLGISITQFDTEVGPVGTIGTTPVVKYNEFGEILNDVGQVYRVVHQFKRHRVLSRMIQQRFAYFDGEVDCAHSIWSFFGFVDLNRRCSVK